VKPLLAAILVLCLLWYTTSDTEPNEVIALKPAQSKVIEQNATQKKDQQNETVQPVSKGPTKSMCITALGKQLSEYYLRQKKDALVAQAFKSLPRKMRTAKRLGLISELSGLDRMTGIKHQPSYLLNKTPAVLAQPDNTVQLSLAKATEVVKLVRSQDYAGLSNMIIAGHIPRSAQILRESLLSAVFELDLNVNASQLQLLMLADLPVTFNDLIAATKAGLSQDAVALLHSNSTVDAAHVWQLNGRNNSLATIAIEALNMPLMLWWQSQGALVSSEKNEINGLNYLPQPSNNKQMEAASTIFEQLVEQGITEAPAATISNIALWLPQESLHKKTLNHIDTPLMDDTISTFVANLKTIVHAIDAQISKAQERETTCLKNHGVSYLNEAQLQGELHVKKHVSNMPDLPTKQQNRQRFFEALEKMGNTMDSEALDNAEKLINLPFSKSWDESLVNAQQLQNSLGEKGTEYYDVLLIQAIQGDAPIEFIKELFALGAHLNDMTILFLANQNNLQLAKQLLVHDLNLHFVDDNGKNAISYSVGIRDSDRMLSFLLNNGVAVKPSNKGLDPLDLALLAITRFEQAVEYAAELVARNAPIEKSHKQQVELLQLTHAAQYQQLIEAVPSLGNR
jgi:hypothetical protein